MTHYYKTRKELEHDLARRFKDAARRQGLVTRAETLEERRKRIMAEIEAVYGKRRAG